MLTVYDGDQATSRRELLRIGGLGLGGLTLAPSLASRAEAASRSESVRGKSVVFLFQQGGPSQFETFDPKTEAPSGIRTVTGTTPTRLPGVAFGDTMTRLATIADRLTIVRSFQTNNGGHNIQPIVGPDSLDANIGVHFARVVGATRAENGMPSNAVLYPAAVSENVPGPSARGDLTSTGPYGKGIAPFVPGAGGDLQKNMELRLPRERFFGDRKALLSALDRIESRIDARGQLESIDDIRAQAYGLLLGGGVRRALDLTNEDPEVVARYDTSRFAAGNRWDKVARGRSGFYNAQASSLGKLLLMARRLCEAGCGFVTVHASYVGVWDMHADGNNLNVVDGMEAVGRSFDHAVAAFVEDLEERGLTDDILLVCCGEMGRTPRINRNGGRDHWSRLAPLLMSGGGLAGGRVIGQSTRDGGEPRTDPLTPANLISTILHTQFDIGRLRLVPGVPPQVLELAEPRPIT